MRIARITLVGRHMRKIIFVACLLICIVAGSWFGFLWKKEPTPAQTQVIPQVTQIPPVEVEVDQVGIPKRLEIEKLNVDIPVEEVGLDSQGRMDTPKNVYNTGWYMLGVKPGESGGALIDGHYDDPQGKPSVFYRLHTLETGDKITVYDENNKPLVFEVQKTETYQFDKVPMGQLIAPTSQKWVHLITCGGKWDEKDKNYTERTVVSALLLE